jgi:phosphatidylserine/phosphatidylglycerophosphate/cardiolipin synthase-like enzyme
VLVDAGPVGGVSRRQVRLLDRLADTGAEVWAYGTEGAPYAYHHAKYAVVDDRALVTTENWDAGGLGGGNRGWGAVVAGADVAAELAAVFRADAAPPAAARWAETAASVDPVYGSVSTDTHPTRLDTARLQAESVRLLTAPDNAQRALIDLLDGARRSVRVQQVSMESGPLLSATVAAARRGVSVRILLSGAEYTRAENRRLADALNDRAERNDWDLRVRVADPGGRFEAVHTKGAIVDDRVVLGSLNWNDHSGDRNREVVLVLDGASVADYYRGAFRADWRGGREPFPTWLVLAGLSAVVLAAVVGYRRVQFGSSRGTDRESAWQRS